jgi:site-specific recombinase XerD
MNQFFSLRKSQKDKRVGTIIENIFDGRLSISRKSIGYKVPLKLWDAKNEKVKVDAEIDYISINSRIQMLREQFNRMDKNQIRFDNKTPAFIAEKDICFIEFCRDILVKDYDVINTQNKYTTIINSLVLFIKEQYNLDRLPIEILRRFDFIYEYAIFIAKQTNRIKDPTATKKNNTRFNYIVVIQTFVRKFNQHHPHLDTIKTDHYIIQVPKKNLEKIKSRMLKKDEIDKIINYQEMDGKKRIKTMEGKYQFLFQFFTSGLRVSDILLMNFKHFVDGRLELVIIKNDDPLSIPFSYKSAQLLSYFYPMEFQQALELNTIGEFNLDLGELETLINIHTEEDFGSLTLIDMISLCNHLKNHKLDDYSDDVLVIENLIRRMKSNVAYSMCEIMGAKEPGHVFDYLPYEDFKDLKISDKKRLTKNQVNLLDKGRSCYNSKLRRIGRDLGFDKLSSHVSRHSFAYHMLESGATIEEISFALGHASIKQTQEYLKQFPSNYADKAIKVFEDSFEL